MAGLVSQRLTVSGKLVAPESADAVIAFEEVPRANKNKNEHEKREKKNA